MVNELLCHLRLVTPDTSAGPAYPPRGGGAMRLGPCRCTHPVGTWDDGMWHVSHRQGSPPYRQPLICPLRAMSPCVHPRDVRSWGWTNQLAGLRCPTSAESRAEQRGTRDWGDVDRDGRDGQ